MCLFVLIQIRNAVSHRQRDWWIAEIEEEVLMIGGEEEIYLMRMMRREDEWSYERRKMEHRMGWLNSTLHPPLSSLHS